jgi:putative peptidoglycan lipid II flippase
MSDADTLLTQPSHSRRLVQAATLVMLFFVTSRVLGLVRDIIITRQFGTTREYEAYLAAFRIPDLIFNIVASGALGSAFIPVFSTLIGRNDTERGWQLASRVINIVLVLTTALGIVVALFAQTIVSSTVAVGFAPGDQALTANLMRVMLLTPIIFGVSGIVSGILNSHHHFVLPALAPLAYNVGIIGGALFLAPIPSFGVFGLALGVVAGAFLHLAVQIPWLVRARMVYYAGFGLRDEMVRTVIRLMLPRTVGIAAVQINFLVNTILASTLPEGRLAALTIAFALILLPEGVIAQSIATVLFPTFAQLEAHGERTALRKAFSTAFRVVLFLTIPASVGLILLRTPLIELLYQRGEFTADSTAQTAFALQFYAVALFAHSGLEILTRAFYALHDTVTPVKVGAASIALNIVLSLLLLQPLAQGGLALATSLATILEMLTLLYLLRTRLGGIDGIRILNSLIKIVSASAAMGLAVLLVVQALDHMSVWIITLGGLSVGVLAFFAATSLLRSEEIALAWRLAHRRI